MWLKIMLSYGARRKTNTDYTPRTRFWFEGIRDLVDRQVVNATGSEYGTFTERLDQVFRKPASYSVAPGFKSQSGDRQS
jgi:hypothetical protein